MPGSALYAEYERMAQARAEAFGKGVWTQLMVGILVAFPGIASTPPPAATLTDKQVEDALKAPPEPEPETPTDPIPTK